MLVLHAGLHRQHLTNNTETLENELDSEVRQRLEGLLARTPHGSPTQQRDAVDRPRPLMEAAGSGRRLTSAMPSSAKLQVPNTKGRFSIFTMFSLSPVSQLTRTRHDHSGEPPVLMTRWKTIRSKNSQDGVQLDRCAAAHHTTKQRRRHSEDRGLSCPRLTSGRRIRSRR